MEMSDTIVNLDEYRKILRKKPPQSLDDIFYASDAVLDVLESEFQEGVAVGLLDGKIQVSATFDDRDLLVEILQSALNCVTDDDDIA